MFGRPIVKGFVVAALSLGVSAAAAQSLPEMRMTPAEIRASALDNNQIGSSGLPGVHTKVVFGDPPQDGGVAVGPQYDTTHVYVAPADIDAFVNSFVATFGGKPSKRIVGNVLPV